MSWTYLLVFFAVFLQLNAKVRDFNYVVDNGLARFNQLFPNNGIRAVPYNYNVQRKILDYQGDRVRIQLYYECLCPDCIDFDSNQFKETVIKLGPHLDINLYPYGNAQTMEHNGHIEFTCQHGPSECYGNKLHACAIDHLRNVTAAVFFNACMMDKSQVDHGSDDRAADVCAHSMGIDSTPIKQCAKSARGDQLLKFYGEESKKANFKYVPYILVNGVENDGKHFMQDVCKAFNNPPQACNGHL